MFTNINSYDGISIEDKTTNLYPDKLFSIKYGLESSVIYQFNQYFILTEF